MSELQAAVESARTRLLNWIDEVNAGTYEVRSKSPRFVRDFEDALTAAAQAEAVESCAKVCDDLYNEDANPKEPRPGIWQVHPEYAIAAKAIRSLSPAKEPTDA